jgi:hypothetical protein
MEPGNPITDALEAVQRLALQTQHWEWVAKAYEQRSADLLYAVVELNHHFFEHGLSRGSLTVRTQEVLTALDLGAYGAN